MAKKTMTVLTCDRCTAETGEDIEAEESVGFGYDGYSYALDLCPPHAENFHATVETMIGLSSERTRTGNGRRSRRTASPPKTETIREWARNNGYPELGNRGRIPHHIVAEYEAAHSG